MTGQLHILAPGPLATLQDLGRPGWAHVGVSASGAADRGSHRLANRLVGNDHDAATIEALFGGLAFTVDTSVVVAVTGAPVPVTVNDRPVTLHGPLYLGAGDVVRLGLPMAGLRSYVAVRGGLDVPPVLGSRSWDSLASLGPAPLAADAIIPIGDGPTRPPAVDAAPVTPPDLGPVTVRALPGPRSEWLLDGADALGLTEWVVSTHSDRVGVRLDGYPLERAPAFERAELPSEGIVRGAVQVPAGGLPVVFLSDHPVTGGYPVVAVLPEAETDRLAQARPGQAVRIG